MTDSSAGFPHFWGYGSVLVGLDLDREHGPSRGSLPLSDQTTGTESVLLNGCIGPRRCGRARTARIPAEVVVPAQLERTRASRSRCYVRPVSRSADTRDHIAGTALAFIDENGIDALTLRALGKATGLHHTAVYRHFKDRDGVLGAVNAIVINEGLERAGTLPDDPRDRLLTLIRGLRAAMRAHPAVTVSHLLPIQTLADSDAAVTFQTLVLSALADLGLTGRELLIHHRLLESYVLGASVFDFGAAPAHLESRRQRLRHVPDPAFEWATRDDASVDELNEDSFDRGLVLIVDECAEVGRSQRATAPVGALEAHAV